MSFALRPSITVVGTETGDVGVGTYKYPLDWRSPNTIYLTEGNGTFQGQGLVSYRTSVTPDMPLTYNLLSLVRAAGSENDPLIALEIVRCFGVRHLSGTGSLLVGNADTFPFYPFLSDPTAYLILQPGSELCFPAPNAGWGVNAVEKNLKFISTSGTVSFEWFVAGAKTTPESSSSSA